MTRRTRRILRIVTVSLALAAVIALIGGVLIFRSGWFHRQVRDRIVAEVEKATGGRTEIGNFQFDWRTMQARVAPFVLHGKEKPGEPAFVTAASVEVGLKIISPLRKDVNVASIVVERPEVHVIVYPDGSTNVPEPKVNRHGQPIAEQLLRLKARHFELHHGIAEVKEQRIPFDIRGDDLMASFDYDSAGPRYNGMFPRGSCIGKGGTFGQSPSTSIPIWRSQRMNCDSPGRRSSQAEAGWWPRDRFATGPIRT